MFVVLKTFQIAEITGSITDYSSSISVINFNAEK
jgi:hypothetical protein